MQHSVAKEDVELKKVPIWCLWPLIYLDVAPPTQAAHCSRTPGLQFDLLLCALLRAGRPSGKRYLPGQRSTASV